MGKVVKALAAVVIAVAIAIAAPALAPALLHLVGAAVTASSLAIAAGVAGALLSAAAALTLAAFASKPSSGSATPTDVRQSLGVTQIIIGKCRVGAILTFFHPRQSGKNYFRYFVWTIAGHRCAGLTIWYLNDLVTTVDGNGKITSGPYAGSGWLWFERGEHAAVPNGTFVAECDGRWTNAHAGNGIAKIYAKFEMTDAIVSAGMPNITIEVEGTDEVYDPRTDTTGYTNNGALAFYWWMALPRAEGGFGCYTDEINQDWVSAQANVCDEDVPLKAGGTEKRYALDGFLTTGSDPSSVRDVLVANMAGRFTYSGGLMLMRPGYWVPVSATLTEDDLVAGISYDLLTASDQRVTEVDATWNDPSNLYQQVALPARSIEDPDAAQASLDLPFIKSHARAERIQKIKLLQSAAEKTLQWPVNIVGLGIGPMDTLRLATTRYSLDNYAFTVTNWGLAQDFSVALTVREENEDMYDWDPADESDYAIVDRIPSATPIGEARAAHSIVRQSVAYPITTTDTSITIAAFSATLDDGSMIDLPAGEINGLMNASSYLVLYVLENVERTLTSPDGTPLLGPDGQTLTSTAFARSYIAAPAPALEEASNSSFLMIRDATTATTIGVYPPDPTPPAGDGGSGYGGGGKFSELV